MFVGGDYKFSVLNFIGLNIRWVNIFRHLPSKLFLQNFVAVVKFYWYKIFYNFLNFVIRIIAKQAAYHFLVKQFLPIRMQEKQW